MHIMIGYHEQAFALFQAQIEFSCFTPDQISYQSFETRCDLFEDWWESEVPRFGERNAKGWNRSLTDHVSTLPQDYSRLRTQSSETHQWGQWTLQENLHSYRNWLPERSPEESSEDTHENFDLNDSFRIVLFDDIRPFLYDIRHITSKALLFRNLLLFLGVDACPKLCSNAPHVWSDGGSDGIDGLEHFVKAVKHSVTKHQLKDIWVRQWPFDLESSLGPSDWVNGIIEAKLHGVIDRKAGVRFTIERVLSVAPSFGVDHVWAENVLVSVRGVFQTPGRYVNRFFF